jgi:hypothetical protein
LVKFTQVPQGYQLDITRYDFFYTAIIEYVHLIKQVTRFLDWKAQNIHSPPMKSKHGLVGMLENIWKKIQAPLGQMLHLG